MKKKKTANEEEEEGLKMKVISKREGGAGKERRTFSHKTTPF